MTTFDEGSADNRLWRGRAIPPRGSASTSTSTPRRARWTRLRAREGRGASSGGRLGGGLDPLGGGAVASRPRQAPRGRVATAERHAVLPAPSWDN